MIGHDRLRIAKYDSEGLPTKQILQDMATNFRDPFHRVRLNYDGEEGDWVMLISAELADQLGEFFQDMANAIPEDV